ncbi:MAG: helix-turn-helix domain-containing protein [Saprospiraceae bacterium]|nr:helix-turn-helix domain-containing protein [Candidatus Defluviibacterium haderslevense]
MEITLITNDQLQYLINEVVKRLETIIVDSKRNDGTTKEWLSAKEVCSILQISNTTLQCMVQSRNIKKYKINRRIMFKNDQIDSSMIRIVSKRLQQK